MEFFFERNWFEMGDSAQLNFASKIFERNFRAKFFRFGRIFPKSANFWLDIGRNSPKSNKIRPKILGRNLTARIRTFSGEQELLCKGEKLKKRYQIELE
jgi:hypothetical protein